MVRSLYISADIEKDNSLTSDPVEGFWQFKTLFGIVFQGQSNSEVLYTLADMEKDMSITYNPVDIFWQSKSHFGVDFQGQSISEVTIIIG